MTDFSTFDVTSPVLAGLGTHLIMSLFLGLILYFAYNKHFFRVITVALIVLAIDLDHFNPLTSIFGGVRIFHNLLFVTLVPAFFMGYFYIKNQETKNYSGVYTSALFFVMLTGHVFYDGMDSTPVLLFYPFANNSIMVSEMFAGMNFVGSMNLTVVTAMYFSALVLLARQGILRIAAAENRETPDMNNLDASQLFPVLTDDSTPVSGGFGNISTSMTRSIQICSTISRPRAANLF
jgi:hypothetical protein